METPLRLFRMSGDVVGIEKQLGYKYGKDAFMPQIKIKLPQELVDPWTAKDSSLFHKIKGIKGINCAQYRGSFVTRTYATTPSGKEIEVGKEVVISRWYVDGCANCKNKLEVRSYVPIHNELATALREDKTDEVVKYNVRIHTTDDLGLERPTSGEAPTYL